MRLFAIEMKKILLIVRRDPRSLLAGIIAPSAALVILYLFFGNFGSIPIGLVDEDVGVWGARLEKCVLDQVSPLGQGPYFERAESGRDKALELFAAGRLAGVLIIPGDFSARVEQHDNPACTYHINNYNSDFAKNMRLYMEEGILAFYSSYYDQVDIRIEEVVTASAQVEWIDIIAVATLLLAFLIGAMFNYLYVFFRERSHNTLILYQVAPRSPLPSFAARAVVALLSSVVAGLFNALLVWLLLGLDLFHLLPSVAPAVGLSALVYLSAAALLSLFVKSFYGTVMGAMGGAMVLWFFTGGLNDATPENWLLVAIFRALPNSYALDIMRGRAFGSSSLDNRLDYLVLVIMAVGWLLAAVLLYRRRMWRRPVE
jgi:ABC-2 type transport system permease protein